MHSRTQLRTPKLRLVAAMAMTVCLIAGALLSAAGLISMTFALAAWRSLDLPAVLVGVGLITLAAGWVLRRIVLHGLRE